METNYPYPCTIPEYLNDGWELIRVLRQKSIAEIRSMMALSDKLAQLNYQRYQHFNPDIEENTRPAMYCFKGDVYQGLNANQFDSKRRQFAQSHIRILSGLYGILKPLDAINPYRLEMGTPLTNPRGANLYEFWRDKITHKIQQELTQDLHPSLVNLASQEYAKVIDMNKLKMPIITPVFKDKKNGIYKIISFYAKKARGMMAAYIINNNITDPTKLTQFDTAGYQFIQAIEKKNNHTELLFHRNDTET